MWRAPPTAFSLHLVFWEELIGIQCPDWMWGHHLLQYCYCWLVVCFMCCLKELSVAAWGFVCSYLTDSTGYSQLKWPLTVSKWTELLWLEFTGCNVCLVILSIVFAFVFICLHCGRLEGSLPPPSLTRGICKRLIGVSHVFQTSWSRSGRTLCSSL